MRPAAAAEDVEFALVDAVAATRNRSVTSREKTSPWLGGVAVVAEGEWGVPEGMDEQEKSPPISVRRI